MVTVNLTMNSSYYNSVKGTLNVLLPEVEIHNIDEDVEAELNIIVKLDTSAGIKVRSFFAGQNNLNNEIEDKEILSNSYNSNDFDKRCKERLKLSIYRLLCDYLGEDLSPWGILTGVRPTKLAHFLLERGFDYQKVDSLLENVYGVAKEKRDLLLNIIKLERSYFPTPEEAKNKVSIYLGIPFCPTRCNYCSFAAYPIAKYQKYLPNFLEALDYEIREVSKVVQDLGLVVDTIYIGGGTPTVLSSTELDRVLNNLKKYLSLSQLRDFTVEAGRADTISKAKLEVLKRQGIKRISINPQTMNLKTLEVIGRKHSVDEVTKSFSLAREIGFENINMDMIIGLPGEGIDDVKRTLLRIKDLNPDSLTVHTMAIKRASRLKRSLEDNNLPSDREVSEMLKYTKKMTKELDLIPYYMYRQKNILGNLENIGYAKAGKESIYNILMMEERETVIGLGGGSITKLINTQDYSLERLVNPKFPKQYIEEIKERTNEKISKINELFYK
ncbi:coproporphyrinogen dehydrogenase HemZ [Orenia marismortui]|uniref:coproporphyrinogen dehydrogenase HemZ n=1 Tax=Orenia marismortui TaxID=46469 RepID=UPI00037FB132|nr:coproporphyrinogen dehydrogenase HemZ [Orenia marismortui]